MKSLNKCLINLDRTIIDDVVDGNLILEISNYVRKFIINIHYEKIGISSKKKTTLTILQFINYMMQETISAPITNQFINHCLGLRSFILQQETDNILNIDEDNIDFDNDCNSFLNKYCIFEDDEDGEDDEDYEEDVKDNENDKSKEQKKLKKLVKFLNHMRRSNWFYN